MRPFLVLTLLLSSCGGSSAEYRVALLIGEGRPRTVRVALEGMGFRCEHTGLLPDKELHRLIEDWAARTPTNSTALIHLGSELQTVSLDQQPTACLMAANDRPIPIRTILQTMSSQGGSLTNHLVAEGPPPSSLGEELPGECRLAFDQLPALPGQASVALSPPERFIAGGKAGEEWVSPRGMVFCWCPPGEYVAGSPAGTPGRYADEVQHKVIIKDGFWIGKYELTRSQTLRNRSSKSIGTHKNHPIEMLHWDDGRGILKRLTTEERLAARLPEDWEYDLPTEEQWEYAARAGTSSRFYFGDNLEPLPQHANFADKSYYDSGDIFSNSAHRTLDDGFVRLAPVGSFLPNPWGLHDVYGNVVEWCRDKGARGGGWVSVATNCRSAYRDAYASRDDQNYLGYRLVIQPNAPAQSK